MLSDHRTTLLDEPESQELLDGEIDILAVDRAQVSLVL
jgi:hypothetical protein